MLMLDLFVCRYLYDSSYQCNSDQRIYCFKIKDDLSIGYESDMCKWTEEASDRSLKSQSIAVKIHFCFT